MSGSFFFLLFVYGVLNSRCLFFMRKW